MKHDVNPNPPFYEIKDGEFHVVNRERCLGSLAALSDIKCWKVWGEQMQENLSASQQREYRLEAELNAIKQTWWYRLFRC